jgi:hypothetical protein
MAAVVRIAPGTYLLNTTVYLPKSVQIVSDRRLVKRAAGASKNQISELVSLDLASKRFIARPAKVVRIPVTAKKRARLRSPEDRAAIRRRLGNH